jgi:hypothetical protein
VVADKSLFRNLLLPIRDRLRAPISPRTITNLARQLRDNWPTHCLCYRHAVPASSWRCPGEVREHILRLTGNPIVGPNGELEAIIRSSGKEELVHALEVIAEMIDG